MPTPMKKKAARATTATASKTRTRAKKAARTKTPEIDKYAFVLVTYRGGVPFAEGEHFGFVSKVDGNSVYLKFEPKDNDMLTVTKKGVTSRSYPDANVKIRPVGVCEKPKSYWPELRKFMAAFDAPKAQKAA